MAREVILSGDDYSGSNPLYFVAYLVSNSNYVNGTAVEPYDATHWPSYAIALQLDGTTGDYFGDFPDVAAGLYMVKIFEKLGATASPSDNDLDADDVLDFNPAAVSDDISASDMVAAIKAALKKSPAAVINVIVDGQTVQYNRAQAIEELKYWQREAARELGLRPRTARIRLDNF